MRDLTYTCERSAMLGDLGSGRCRNDPRTWFTLETTPARKWHLCYPCASHLTSPDRCRHPLQDRSAGITGSVCLLCSKRFEERLPTGLTTWVADIEARTPHPRHGCHYCEVEKRTVFTAYGSDGVMRQACRFCLAQMASEEDFDGFSVGYDGMRDQFMGLASFLRRGGDVTPDHLDSLGLKYSFGQDRVWLDWALRSKAITDGRMVYVPAARPESEYLDRMLPGVLEDEAARRVRLNAQMDARRPVSHA